MGGLYTYVMPYDIGFAPNPYHGACTLATCKPGIRRTAQPGDWVVGIGSKQRCRKNLMIYAMRVQEILSYDEYWESPRFARKKPFRAGSLKQRYGDNVYHHTIDGREWVQEDSRHSLDGGTPNPKHLKRDTSAPQVLVSTSFAYYGDQAIEIPVQFRVWMERKSQHGSWLPPQLPSRTTRRIHSLARITSQRRHRGGACRLA